MRQLQLTTDRLILRILPPQEAHRLVAWDELNRAHLAPWEPAHDPAFFTPAYFVSRQEQALRDYETGNAIRLVMQDRASGELVGRCSLTNIVRGPFQACHLGYCLGYQWEGQGLMHEALRAVIDHAFTDLDLHRIMANYMPANVRSGRLLARLGFVQEGVAKSYLQIAGKWEDHVLTALVNDAL